jgi:RNA polymerase sigma-54 factor
MLNQSLQQKMLQKLSPQQIQLMKLLQLPTLALEQRIKQEIEENPALEEGRDEEEEENQQDDSETDLLENELDNSDTTAESEETRKEDDFNLSDYLDDYDDTPSYKLHANNSSPDDERREIPFSSGQTFAESLISQLGMKHLSDEELIIGEYLIGNLDDSGYLQRELASVVNDLVFSAGIQTNLETLEMILGVIQELDPPGVGARNLRECLLLQLLRREDTSPAIVNAHEILKHMFDEFTRKHYEKISKKLSLTDEQLKEAIEVILKLNPKPGNTAVETQRSSQYIIPDFILFDNDGMLDITMNSRNAPELRQSRQYVEMLAELSRDKTESKSKQKDAIVFVKQKLDSAKWFIDAIRQRQATLENTMRAILEYQYEYFREGDETMLRPMILKDIADRVHLDISTVSRVVNSKYIQTPFGTFLLKSFFSESLSTDSGEEVSSREVKKILTNCIEGENKRKPLTDDRLAEILNEKGYNIARRTVAKYREMLNIPVARMRKQL